ncbi:MAG: threalose-6-phosphate phosphatase [Alyxoria varia]|nr:MAG: threalose-6-phosphate phosphatase [Alyxoria varia]
MPSLISAVFCLKPAARGQSALFDSFSYLSSPSSGWDHILVGWTGEISGQLSQQHRANKEDEFRAAQGGVKVVPIWLHDRVDDNSDLVSLGDQGRWRRYGEHELFTLFHYKQRESSDGGRNGRAWWFDYLRMNQAFADRIVEIYQPGDFIWIHDYHLCLVPAMLRKRLEDAAIGFFLHIPFPSSEYIRCLSRRNEVLEGMLGASLIGFQNHGYSQHFSSCCKRILGLDSSSSGVDVFEAHVAFDAFPIGIQATTTEEYAFHDQGVEDKTCNILDLYAGKRLIVGRDRLDSVRGVPQKLQAFEMFLQQFPQWQEKVVLIQVTSPTSIEEERDEPNNKTSNKVSELVAKINGTYGSLSYSPVRHYSQYLSKEEYFALLRAADVGLITSVRDGMNTASLEYIICQKKNHGPLILSEFSGTAGSLDSAIHINPWDLKEVAKSIDHALSMSEKERTEQFDKSYAHVSTNTAESWVKKFLDRLSTTVSSYRQPQCTPALDRTLLLNKYRSSSKRLFMFDYDGTLTPIVKDPQSAMPSDRVIRTLKSLAADPKNSVWIVSGRDQKFLDDWMGHIHGLGLSAEHGSFLRHPMQTDWENVTEETDMSWQDEVLKVFKRFTEKTPGSFFERKKVALTWHYRRADPEFGVFQAKECRKILEERVAKKWDVEVMEGKANLEVRPSFVNKGAIAKRLIVATADPTPEAGTHDGSTETSSSPPDFVLCCGDDFTDEDMFRALNEATHSLQDHHEPHHDIASHQITDIKLPSSTSVFTVSVGASSRPTEAKYHLLEASDVVSTVGTLVGQNTLLATSR